MLGRNRLGPGVPLREVSLGLQLPIPYRAVGPAAHTVCRMVLRPLRAAKHVETDVRNGLEDVAAGLGWSVGRPSV